MIWNVVFMCEISTGSEFRLQKTFLVSHHWLIKPRQLLLFGVARIFLNMRHSWKQKLFQVKNLRNSELSRERQWLQRLVRERTRIDCNYGQLDGVVGGPVDLHRKNDDRWCYVDRFWRFSALRILVLDPWSVRYRRGFARIATNQATKTNS